MIKSIITPKKALFSTLIIVAMACFLAIFLIPNFSSSSSAAQSEGRYKIGERVTDPEGTVWEYLGNFRVELGQLTPELKLLSVIICGVEREVFFIHKETIPDVVIGDTFKLIVPSPELSYLIESTPGSSGKGAGEGCNTIVSDPPALGQVSPKGTLCCLFLNCD